MLKACHLIDIIGEATPPSPPYLTPGISGTVDGDGGGGGVCVEGGGGWWWWRGSVGWVEG